MRFAVLLILTVLSACSQKAEFGEGVDWVAVESKAEKGDAKAAWSLHGYYAFGRHDEATADVWLRRAAHLKYPEAEYALAWRIKNFGFAPDGFGSDEREAVHNLLAELAPTDGRACFEMADAYRKGYFGKPDEAEARHYLEIGSKLNNRMCWEELSRFHREGLGGPIDNVAAYYWISLETRCTDPRSVSGKETWGIREEIASALSISDLEHEWKETDDFVSLIDAGRVKAYQPPFDPAYETEGRRLAVQREAEHRKRWRGKKS